MEHIKLYTKDTNDNIRVWWVETENNTYRQNYGVLDGKIVTTGWTYCEGKNLGKANETTPTDQVEKEVKALIKKQLKSNYFENINDVDKAFLEPQLAKPCKEYLDKIKWEDGQIVDEKLNGIACIITKKGAVSRKNEVFYAIPHILKELKPVFDLYPNAYLHGELFNPEYVNQLNKIAELVAVTRKEKDITPDLLIESERMVQYHLYDGYGFLNTDLTTMGRSRRDQLKKLITESNLKYCKLVNYTVCNSFDEMKSFYDVYVSEGGEGVIIRNPFACYNHGRTKNLLKFKKSETEEFKVISIEEGEANWSGCAKFVWCELPNGLKDKKFKSNIKGTQEHLRTVFKNRDSYVGKTITVEFQEYSPYNTPLIPYTDLLERNYE